MIQGNKQQFLLDWHSVIRSSRSERLILLLIKIYSFIKPGTLCLTHKPTKLEQNDIRKISITIRFINYPDFFKEHH